MTGGGNTPVPGRRKDEAPAPPAANSGQFEALTEAMLEAGGPQPGWLVALGRQDRLPGDRKLAMFAQAMGLDAYSARQRLLAPAPRVIRREPTPDAAREWAEWFRALGLRAFEVGEEEITAWHPQPQRTLDFHDDALTFTSLDGTLLEVPIATVVCLVAGTVSEKLAEDATTGGLLAKAETAWGTLRAHSEALLDLHVRGGAVLRIAQDSFQWEALFPGTTGQSSLHFRELSERLRRALPDAPWLDDFGRAESVLGQSRQVVESSTFMRLNWTRPGAHLQWERREILRESNRETFDLYSLLTGLDRVRG